MHEFTQAIAILDVLLDQTPSHRAGRFLRAGMYRSVSDKHSAKIDYECVLTSIDANAMVAKSELTEMGCDLPLVCGSKCMDPDS